MSWEQAYTLANTTVANLTTSEKIGILHGVGQFNSALPPPPTAPELTPSLQAVA